MVAPKLVCPRDVDVTVADWADNSTVVHYDGQRPQVSDNSGHVEYRVVGVPDRQRRFPVGSVALTYEAFDAAGNTASCVQHVRVRGPYVWLDDITDWAELELPRVVHLAADRRQFRSFVHSIVQTVYCMHVYCVVL